MESLWIGMVIPFLFWYIKKQVDRKYKKNDKEDEARANAEKKKYDGLDTAIKGLQDTQNELIKKIDSVENDLGDKEDLKQNRDDHKDIWEHFRKEIEDIKEKVGEIRGELKGMGK